jgi:release factor glutamine methyltransferase
VKRAGEQEPIAYLTGRAHFFNMEFDVGPGVLIPRPDTETLVESAIGFARGIPGLESPRILDLCTGSGCIAAALAKNLSNAVVLAIDKSEVACKIATDNIERLHLAHRVTVVCGDLFEPLSTNVTAQPFDLIVANPPYIPTNQVAELDRTVKDYEPLEALDGGLDGLTLHRRILHEALERLTPIGRVYLEIAFDQAPAAIAMAESIPGWADIRVLKDYAAKDRVLTARKA